MSLRRAHAAIAIATAAVAAVAVAAALRHQRRLRAMRRRCLLRVDRPARLQRRITLPK